MDSTTIDSLIASLRGLGEEDLARAGDFIAFLAWQRRQSLDANTASDPRVWRSDLIDLFPSGRARAKVVAGNLGMTERTMHRRLASENTSFGQIHERLRRDLALKYVREEKLNLQQIAYLLGYSDQSAFSVAFRRWTDRTPTEMRQGG